MTDSKVVLHVLVPVSLGGAIYLLARSPSLLVFDWVERVGALELFMATRAALAPVVELLPSWFRFSVPDGAWVYGLTSAMALVWSGRHSLSASAWVFVGLALGAGGEIGQALGIVPGTFDVLDLLFILLGCSLALAFTRQEALPRV